MASTQGRLAAARRSSSLRRAGRARGTAGRGGWGWEAGQPRCGARVQAFQQGWLVRRAQRAVQQRGAPRWMPSPLASSTPAAHPPSSPCLLLSQKSTERRGAPASSASTCCAMSFCGRRAAHTSAANSFRRAIRRSCRRLLAPRVCEHQQQGAEKRRKRGRRCGPEGARTVLTSAGRAVSTTSRRRSQALALSAQARPRRRTRLGRSCACDRGTGPCTTPPPRLRASAGQEGVCEGQAGWPASSGKEGRGSA